MQVVVNGETTTAREGLNLTEFLSEMGLDPGRVAVELDRSIVPREAWSSTPLHEGARLEIVQFVGGG